MDYRTKILKLRSDYLRGRYTYEEVKTLVEPLLTEMNAKGKVIAKKFGRKYKPLTFNYVFR